jgi:hypothetical protein
VLKAVAEKHELENLPQNYFPNHSSCDSQKSPRRSANSNNAAMVTKSKLKMALAADKGTDFGKLHLKKKEKAARKGKASKSGEQEAKVNGKKVEEEWEDVEEEGEGSGSDEEDSGSEEEVGNSLQVCYQIQC